MKKKNLLFSTLAIAIGITGLVSCKKNFKEEPADKSSSATLSALAGRATCTCESTTDSTISGVITSDLYLEHCKEYQLSGLVYVSNNATLYIEPGTRIVGLAGTPGTPGTPGGGLIITRGSKIIADGTETCPIVFTSYRWDGTGENAPQSGDWAGVVILGHAPVNKINPLIEGIPSNPPADAHYGPYDESDPGDCDDTSGVLRYVRIEYAGYELNTDNEINGLTFGGVGCGTVVDFVQVYKPKDDAFEFFGGTVNATHLVAVDALDDMFDTDLGYVGHIQWALGLSDSTRADKSQSNGMESDNDNVPQYTATPQTLPTISNLTIIGVEDSARAVLTNRPPSGTGSYGRAAHIRRNSGFIVDNSVFMGFKWGITLDGTPSQNKLLGNNPVSCFENNLVHAFAIPFRTENLVGTWTPSGTNTGYTSYYANDDIKLTDPFVRETYNFASPGTGSPALTNTFYSACFSGGCCGFGFTNTSGYIGAFGGGENDNWAQDLLYGGWARYRDGD